MVEGRAESTPLGVVEEQNILEENTFRSFCTTLATSAGGIYFHLFYIHNMRQEGGGGEFSDKRAWQR